MSDLYKKEAIKNKQNEIIDLIKKRKGLEWLEYDYTYLSRQMGKFTWWMMSLMTFSPETTILNILSESEILEEYVSTLFDGISETQNEKIQDEFLEILDKAKEGNPDKLAENFIYDTAFYFLQNPINIEDSDPAYSSFKKAAEISKKFTKGKYQIIKQEKELTPEDIDPKKLFQKLLETKSDITPKEIISILTKLYWSSISFPDLTLKK